MPLRFIVYTTSIKALILSIALLPLTAWSDEQTWLAALEAAQQHDYETAIAKATHAMDGGVGGAGQFRYRGRWNFQLGRMKESLADFDRCVSLAPESSSQLWERGITCYYTGDYRTGAKQFEAYQTYHSNDVENAVWRYLCQSKLEDREKARAAILPIEHDPRIPMMEIYQLFRGELKPQAVIDRLRVPNTKGEALKEQVFHGDLYLGLYYHAEGDLASAKKHIDRAVNAYKTGPYMWAVAVQHQRLMRENDKTQTQRNVQ